MSQAQTLTCDEPTAMPSLWLSVRALAGSLRVRVLSGLAVLLIARLLYLLVCPLELIPDEAYYWDWSRQLDWSYYSKPPVIAWLIALVTSVLGESEFAIRVPAALAGTLGLWVVYELGRAMYGHRTGVWALLIVGASPGMAALCMLMTIDAPFLLAWALAVYCLWGMLGSGAVDTRWVIPAIAATGFALLAKQSALGLFPLVVLFLASGSTERRLLKSPSLAVWLAGSLSCLLPVALWNFDHGWITVAHTSSHLSFQSATLVRHLTWYLEFATSQFGILSPLLAALTILVMAGLTRRFFRLQRRERFLYCFGGIPLIAVTLLSFMQRVQPNWPVALHLTPVIAVAAWHCGELSMPGWDGWKKWLTTGLAVSVVMSLLVSLTPVVIPISPLSGTKLDLTGRLRGWRELGDQVAEKLQSLSPRDDLIVVAATSRGPVSELAYYLPGRPRVYRWNVGQVVDSQHDVWGGPTDAQGCDAVIVTEGTGAVPDRLVDAFRHVEDLGPVEIVIGPSKSRHFRVWLGTCLRHWPDPCELNSLISFNPTSQLHTLP